MWNYETAKPKDGNCKIFGYSLIAQKPAISHISIVDKANCLMDFMPNQVHTFEFDQKSEKVRGSKLADNLVAGNDQEKSVNTSQ